jgi:Rrf2 family transcriptional regulator, nitric oxide-sensitive transcriptional repressor
MELSQFTDYSLRVLIYVGVRGEQVSVREIAESYSISQHHLVKVVHQLAKLGFLKTLRGRNGGITLGRDPGEIRAGDVVRGVESFGLAECFPERGGGCVIDGTCLLKGALAKARGAFLAELDKLTIADLIVPRERLLEALGSVGLKAGR